MRLFIAIDSPPWIKKSLFAAEQQLPPGVRRVDVQNMHITLKFLGEVSPKKVDGIRQRLRAVNADDFEIVVKGVGAFPNEQYVKVVWAGCRTPKLAELAAKIDSALPEFPKEPFTGHITIGRVNGRVALAPLFLQYRDFRFGDFFAKKFSLMASELTPQGPKYAVLEDYGLKERAT